MTRKQIAARRAAERDVGRLVEIRIEGYLAARASRTRGLDKPGCPYAGAEGIAWEAGWQVAQLGHWTW